MSRLNQLLEEKGIRVRVDYELPESTSAETLLETVSRLESELGIAEEADHGE